MIKTMRRTQYLKRQRGFVLAVAMIFLLLMTIFAVTTIRNRTLDEKVAANMKDNNIAFQAAESMLRYCQADLIDSFDSGRGGMPVGVYVTKNNIPVVPYPSNLEGDVPLPPDTWKIYRNWNTTNSAQMPDALKIPGVAEQPRCMIEEWSFKLQDKRPVIKSYLITARGVGAVSTSVVWLQATFRLGGY